MDPLSKSQSNNEPFTSISYFVITLTPINGRIISIFSYVND
ncbi:hypothetical protein [Rossellomorea sp. LJF3]